MTKSFHITPELEKEIGAYKYANNIKSDSEAIRLLLTSGMKNAKRENPEIEKLLLTRK
jgi:hypothetical protein